jgi:hypothetical protein
MNNQTTMQIMDDLRFYAIIKIVFAMIPLDKSHLIPDSPNAADNSFASSNREVTACHPPTRITGNRP